MKRVSSEYIQYRDGETSEAGRGDVRRETGTRGLYLRLGLMRLWKNEKV